MTRITFRLHLNRTQTHHQLESNRQVCQTFDTSSQTHPWLKSKVRSKSDSSARTSSRCKLIKTVSLHLSQSNSPTRSTDLNIISNLNDANSNGRSIRNFKLTLGDGGRSNSNPQLKWNVNCELYFNVNPNCGARWTMSHPTHRERIPVESNWR